MRDGEDFTYRETAGLYLILGTELDVLSKIRSVLNGVESSGTTARNLRELGKLTEKALENQI